MDVPEEGDTLCVPTGTVSSVNVLPPTLSSSAKIILREMAEVTAAS